MLGPSGHKKKARPMAHSADGPKHTRPARKQCRHSPSSQRLANGLAHTNWIPLRNSPLKIIWGLEDQHHCGTELEAAYCTARLQVDWFRVLLPRQIASAIIDHVAHPIRLQFRIEVEEDVA